MDNIKNLFDSTAASIKKAASNAQSAAGDIASGVTDRAGSIATGVAGAATTVASSALDAAGDLASGVSNAVGGTVASVGQGIDNYKQKKLEEQAAALESAESARRLTIERVESPSALKFLEHLGASPIPTLDSEVSKIKTSFPVPVEQDILWADAEFDLRPSGIVATNKGVYVKTDAVVFSLPFSKDGDKETCSRLVFIPWAYFEPDYFTASEGVEDVLAVDVDHSKLFIEACRYMTAVELAVDESYDVQAAYETGDPKAAVLGAAGVLSAESAVFPEQKAARANPGGHGEMAEEANNLIDRFLGMDAEVVGRDNAKNGADRKVNGIEIQTKYYNSARGTLESAFDAQTGQYRYVKGDKAMQLEVPKDQYERVIEGFRKKIEQGKVPGVRNPAEAENIVRKGHLTYEQAVKLTKPGTVESLTYDAATGVVTCACSFGISFVAATYNAYRKTGNLEQSVQAGIAAGVQVFGISFVQHILVSQMARTSAANLLMSPSQFLVEKLGYKATQTLVNGLRALSGKSAISGAAASRQLAKIFRSNVITTAITLAVFSVPETYSLANKRITGAQYVCNMANLTGSVIGGAGGMLAAGAAAAKVAGVAGTAIAPGVGTAIGIAGGLVGGAAASAATSTVGNILYEGDATVITRLFNAYVACMATEYMLDEQEVSTLTEELNGIDPSEFKNLFADFLRAKDQESVMRGFLEPRFEKVVSAREPFVLPSLDCVDSALSDMLISMN